MTSPPRQAAIPEAEEEAAAAPHHTVHNSNLNSSIPFIYLQRHSHAGTIAPHPLSRTYHQHQHQQLPLHSSLLTTALPRDFRGLKHHPTSDLRIYEMPFLTSSSVLAVRTALASRLAASKSPSVAGATTAIPSMSSASSAFHTSSRLRGLKESDRSQFTSLTLTWL